MNQRKTKLPINGRKQFLRFLIFCFSVSISGNISAQVVTRKNTSIEIISDVYSKIDKTKSQTKHLKSNQLAFSGFYLDWRSWLDEPMHFEQGSSTIQLGIGLVSNVDVERRASAQDQLSVDKFIPAVHLLYERHVWENFGAGITLGAQIWKVPVLKYQYRYYTGGLRISYHFNLLDNLDPYVALAGIYRRTALTNNNRNLAESTTTFHFITGVKYYFTDRIGGYFELGNDTTSFLKFGLSFYLN